MINTPKVTTTISGIGPTWREADVTKQEGWLLDSSSCPHEDRGPSDLHGFVSPPHHLSLKRAEFPSLVSWNQTVRSGPSGIFSGSLAETMNLLIHSVHTVVAS